MSQGNFRSAFKEWFYLFSSSCRCRQRHKPAHTRTNTLSATIWRTALVCYMAGVRSTFPLIAAEWTQHIFCMHKLPWWLSGKESACNSVATGGVGSVPRSGKSSGGGQGNWLQYCCLENSMDRGAWWATQPMELQSRTLP